MKRVLESYKFYGILIAGLCLHLTGNIVKSQRPPVTSQCSASCRGATEPCECYEDGSVDCSNKNVSSIPVILPECVKNLVIRQNRITDLENCNFQGLTLLHRLEIQNEHIMDIPQRLFVNLSNLTSLILSNNQISTIAELAFEGLISLRSLTLNYNNLTVIHSRTFYGMPMLKILSISHNNISIIDSMAFEGLVNLENLILISNSLSSLDVRWFEAKPFLASVDVSKNKWNCTCQLKQDYHFISTTYHLPIICEEFFGHFCIECNGPIAFRGNYLNNIDYSQLSMCNQSNYNETMTTSSVVHSLPSTPSSGVALLSTPNPTNTISVRNLKSSTLQISTMANQQIPRKYLPIWSIVLIIITLAVILVTAVILAKLYIRQSHKKIQQSQSRIELQPHNFSNKSYELENENT